MGGGGVNHDADGFASPEAAAIAVPNKFESSAKGVGIVASRASTRGCTGSIPFAQAKVHVRWSCRLGFMRCDRCE